MFLKKYPIFVSLFEGANSSAGPERLPYKQDVGGSNPSSPTTLKPCFQGFFCFRSFRHRSEQYFTSSQTFSHFFRQTNSLEHVSHILLGRNCFFMIRVEAIVSNTVGLVYHLPFHEALSLQAPSPSPYLSDLPHQLAE